ncbi:MAG: substrate-binding domain-containing protein [Burkholderiales bacterium]|nr:substrate-binding domain-containing protein [Burkholderiales bacterium]MDE2564294.1 substrate-binding domain-containing protein [Burkholderiales bacterium]
MPINLKTFADRLGLSQSTISRALGDYQDVSPATREHVRRMALELGYEPSRAARQTARGRTEAIGMIFSASDDDFGNPHILRTLAGLSTRLEARNYELQLAVTDPAGEMRAYERAVRTRSVDALIVAQTRCVDERIAYLAGTQMPFLAYGRTARPEGMAWFDFDAAAGSRLAVARLVELGHRRIAYVHHSFALNYVRLCHAGFLAGMKKAELQVAPQAVIEAFNTRQDGYMAGERLLALRPRPTAVIVDGNMSGFGLIRALLDAGVAIGSEISVVINGGIEGDLLPRGLSVAAIVQPTFYTTGEKLADMVLCLAQRRPLDEPRVLMKPQFLAGNSLGQAPAL